MSDSTRIGKLRKEIESLCGNCDRPDKEQLGEIILSSMALGFSYGINADRPQGKWIPCSERLPSNFSEDETVLATTDVDGDRVIAMFALDVKSFYLKGYVSAWMPLPKPYGREESE